MEVFIVSALVRSDNAFSQRGAGATKKAAAGRPGRLSALLPRDDWRCQESRPEYAMKVPSPPRRSMLPLEKSDASRQDDRAQYRNRIGTSSKNVRSSLQHGALMCIAYPALK